MMILTPEALTPEALYALMLAYLDIEWLAQHELPQC